MRVYDAWQLSSIGVVWLTMPLSSELDISPLVETAHSVVVAFAGRKRAHLYANIPDSRQHLLAFYELGRNPGIALAQILGAARGLRNIQMLHLPLGVLAPLVTRTFVLPQLACLVVYVLENDRSGARSHLEDDEQRGFSWDPLTCLSEVPRCFPSVAAPVLAVQKDDRSLRPTLDDAQGLLAYLALPGNCTLREVHVQGFSEDVRRRLPAPLESDYPRVIFTAGVYQTFRSYPAPTANDA